MPRPIKVGVSSCLLGREVRYNGGHTQSKLCLNTLSRYFEFNEFCPEVSSGFSIPRPTMRLTGDPSKPYLSYSDNHNIDLSEQLIATSRAAMPKMSELCGYILMKNSPSCGLERIKVYQNNGHPHKIKRNGLFTEQLMAHYPNMPVEEEGRLHDKHLYENFVLRVFCYHEWRASVLQDLSVSKMMSFHSKHKLVLQAHSPLQAKNLGRMLATASVSSMKEVAENYEKCFMEALSRPANKSGHCNVMMRILGFLKKTIDQKNRSDILDVIKSYRQGEVPLVAPLTLLKHYIPRCGGPYINTQNYFDPYPLELGLRNSL